MDNLRNIFIQVSIVIFKMSSQGKGMNSRENSMIIKAQYFKSRWVPFELFEWATKLWSKVRLNFQIFEIYSAYDLE